MSADFASTQLSHHFLIAMPGLEDPTFAKSVVYVCEHSERGAMGLIINKPGDLSLKHLFEKVELPLHRQDLLQSNVLHGGPVQTERGFVLHDPVLEKRFGGFRKFKHRSSRHTQVHLRLHPQCAWRVGHDHFQGCA